MQIKKITCKQFGGIQDKKWEFSNGLNILCGKNETGKSTMVDLMFSLLFEEISVRSNGDFQKMYFPKKAEGIPGDFVKGEIVFETDNGTYILSKKWKSKGKGESELTFPDGSVIDDSNKIKQIIGKELTYERGTFDEIVFASQKRTMTLMQGLFLQTEKEKKPTKNDEKKVAVKNELSSMVTKAVMETGGINVKQLEERLNNILYQYNERWDFDMDEPEGGVHKRGIDNKWECAITKKADNGEQAIILRAYYEKQEIEDLYNKAINVEKAIDEFNEKLREAKKKKQEASDKREDFLTYKSTLEKLEAINSLKTNASNALKEMDRDLQNWPKIEKNYEDSQELKEKLESEKCRKLYCDVKKLKDILDGKKTNILKLEEIKEDVIDEALKLEGSIDKLSGQLRGLNITAKISQLGSVSPEVYSVNTGTKIEIDEDMITIEEAVKILVPGIMELQIMPKGINIEQIEEQLSKDRCKYKKILQQYSVKNAEELKEKQRNYNKITQDITQLEKDIKKELGGQSWENLQQNYLVLPEQKYTLEEIETKIKELCNEESLEVFIGIQQGAIKQFKKKYNTMENLEQCVQDKANEISGYQTNIDEVVNIPEEYRVNNIEKYDKTLKANIDLCEDDVNQWKGKISNKEKELPEQSSEEYAEQLKEKQEIFEKQKKIYIHWKHISEIVKQVKDELTNNPMEDIEDKFRNYLSILSDGVIALNEFNDCMDSSISSGKNQLAYEILSEGTKDTIALAFRLAMLEHLYPDGGGLAVFDDPFTDMDPDRTRQACQLIQKFAENNQVIFVTCDPKYAEIMEGEVEEFQ